MRNGRTLTLVIALLMTLAIVGFPLERSRSLSATLAFLVPFFATTAILAILTVGLNIQWGYTGIINFGVVGFFLVGAYTAALITLPPADSEFVVYAGGFGEALAFFPGSGVWFPFLVAIVGAGLVSAVLALLLAGPTLRLREDYLAITTIGVAEVLRRITIEEATLVNGTRGLTGIPAPFREWVGDPSTYNLVFLGLTLMALLLVYLLVERGVRSPWGRVLRALREDEAAASASGKNVFRFKMGAFVFGATIMGISGALFAFQQSSISPDTFTHFFGTFIIWAMLVAGGSGNTAGAILGAYVIWGFWGTSLQIQGYPLPEFIGARVFFLRDFLIGVVIVVVLLVRPRGLLPEEARVSRWVEERRRLAPDRGAAPSGAAPTD